jgi:hypothetical protein
VINLVDIYKQLLEEKEKRDRCLRIADRKYDKPSAYKSGAVVRCRQGKIWKDIKEEIKASEAHYDNDAIQTVIDGKRDLGFITLKAATLTKGNFWDIIDNNNLRVLKVPSNPYEAYIYYRPGAENKAKELKDIAEKYQGYLSYRATDNETRRIGELLGYSKEDIESHIEDRKRRGISVNEAESLHKWFNRQGAKGKEKGWVDCNAPDGEGGYKPCGRKEGEKRSKYPACRPTPGACKDKGKGKTWGKTK